MKKILFAVMCIIATLTACDDTTGTLGSSLTNIEDMVNVADGTFKVTSRSVRADSVYSRSKIGYLGNVKDPETGVYVKGGFTTQFHIAENQSFTDKDSLVNGVNADSCFVRFYYKEFYGDSLSIMKATLYELEKPLEESQQYYSNFDPIKEGYVRTDANALKSTLSYSIANQDMNDTVRSQNYKYIKFQLSNIPYTAKDGTKYSNYGSYVMDQYYKHPEYFKNSYTYAHHVSPGFCIVSESGVGSMADVFLGQFHIYYQSYRNDSVRYVSTIFPSTNEVTQSTSFSTDKEALDRLAEDNTCTYLKTPSGIATELTLPVEDIMKGHENDTINSAKVVLRTINGTTDSKYAFDPPTTVMMVECDSVLSFFRNKKLVNYRNTFIATYSSGKYQFGNIGQLIQTMYSRLSAATDKEAWKKEHPNWNKVYVVPVNASYTTYSSTSLLTDISNDMSLSSVKLVGGSENPNGDIEISVIYSKFVGQ